MKSNRILTVIASLFCTVAGAGLLLVLLGVNLAQGQTPPSAPLLHLPFDGNTQDLSGNNNHGTPSAGLTYGPGVVGSAAVFAGNQKIDFDGFSIKASDYTIAGFFLTSMKTDGAIVGLGSTLAALQIAAVPNPGNLRFIDRPGGGSAGGISVFSPLGYSDNSWHHFSIRKSGTSSTLFVDGVLILSGAGTAGTFNGMTDFVLGQNTPESATRRFVGSLDEIRVYTSALSDTEIAALAAPLLSPTLTSVNPSSGNIAGGTRVTLTGTGFTGATSVTFGGFAATTVTVVNPTTITCITPARAAGTASVLVTTPGGVNAANTLFTYGTPSAPPTLANVTPSNGSGSGGTSVTLTGTGFTGATSVTFGGKAATAVKVVNPTTITCITPEGFYIASVLVTTPSGTNAANRLFYYNLELSFNIWPIPTSNWDFKDPAKLGNSTFGRDLSFEGTPPTSSPSSPDDSGKVFDGVMITPPASNTNRIRADHGIAPNGGGTRVNQYSIVADILSPPESRSSLRSIFQTSTNNADESEYSIQPNNDTLGATPLGYTTAPINEAQWTRLAITADLTQNGGDIKTFLNGALHHTHPTNLAVDDPRYSLGPFVHMFSDGNGGNAPIQVGALAFFDKALSPAEVAVLGVAGSAILPTEPLLYLPLDGSTQDVSGNNNHGAPSAGLTYGPGVVGTAAVFTANQKIDFDGFSINAADYTITGFFATQTSGAEMAIFGLGSESGTFAALQISAGPTPGNLRFINRPDGETAGGISVFSPLGYSDGAFHHFAIRKSGTNSTLFVDGARVFSGTGTAVTFKGLTDFVIGQSSPESTTRRFVGSLDEIRVYASALSESEIAALALSQARFRRITAFKYNRAAATVDMTFNSEQRVNYAIETSTNGQTWMGLGSPVPGTEGATTTSVTGRPLQPPVADWLLLRVRVLAS